ncbi:HEAT repeat domain-containing protein [Hydrogenobaculum acidophilum]
MSDLIKWFCPYCWSELDKDYEICPHCGHSLKDFTNLDFDDKLILGLDNPIIENRMMIINILGRRRVSKAAQKLCEMLFDERDTYELIEIANSLFLIGSNDSLDCLINAKEKLKDNKILTNFISKKIRLVKI